MVSLLSKAQPSVASVHGGLTQVVVHHGNKRETSIEELKQADVVLTTYSIIENEFRKNCLPDKVPCAYCNKKFFHDRLKVHLRYAAQWRHADKHSLL